MKIELRYFTGTGNSLKVLKSCADCFAEKGAEVHLSSITLGENIGEADLIGFCFPVYAFGIPRICRKYLKSLKRFKQSQQAFVLITAGSADESGLSVMESERILRKKNGSVIYSAVVEMPINWIVSMNPPTREEAVPIIEKGVAQARKIAEDLLNGINQHHRFNYPKRYSRLGFYKDYLLFKYLGIYNLWRMYEVNSSCNGCGLCSRICPVRGIEMVSRKPVWNSRCEQCMRCVNCCPNEAIHQLYGGNTSGRNRYLEPDFKPLKEENLLRLDWPSLK
ncbi:MAG TPA: EFR1 family ferrodoxin [Prolixibacteraceae bacterium]|nr:EFR1 family ferrodoxin [Prolixibacteraceae bacterium]